jgi:SAM-dependent methyltransferase
MLAVARRELEHRKRKTMVDVRLLLGDVTALDAVLGEVPKDGFDVIICSNAFVLLPDPTGVAAHWRRYLRPGGLLVVDIPHEDNMRSGRVMGGVAARLGKRWEAERSWIRGKSTFTDVLECAGYEVERVDELEKVVGRREVFYTADEADGQFDYVVRSDLANSGFMEEIGKDVKATELFREEFVKMAGQDGRVAVVEANYVYLARRRS